MLVAFILAPMALLAQNEPASPSARDEGAPRGRAVRHEHPNLTVQQKAHKMTDQMDRLLTLTDKQYQKIYKLNLKELKEMEADSLFMGRHRGFGPGMGPGPGFGPGGPGNRAQFERDMARLGSESNPLTEQQMEELRAAHEKSRLKRTNSSARFSLKNNTASGSRQSRSAWSGCVKCRSTEWMDAAATAGIAPTAPVLKRRRLNPDPVGDYLPLRSLFTACSRLCEGSMML